MRAPCILKKGCVCIYKYTFACNVTVHRQRERARLSFMFFSREGGGSLGLYAFCIDMLLSCFYLLQVF